MTVFFKTKLFAVIKKGCLPMNWMYTSAMTIAAAGLMLTSCGGSDTVAVDKDRMEDAGQTQQNPSQPDLVNMHYQIRQQAMEGSKQGQGQGQNQGN